MRILKKILPRLFVLSAFVVALNFLYTNTLYTSDLINNGDLYNRQIEAVDSCDILYYAESSNFSMPKVDTLRLFISEMLGEFYPSLKIVNIDKGGIHSGVYKSLISAITDNVKVKTLIVTMNLRSFGEDWINSSLENDMNRFRLFMNNKPPLWNRFMLSLKNYEIKTKEQRHIDFLTKIKHNNLIVESSFKYTNTHQWDWSYALKMKQQGWDKKKIEIGSHFIKNYGFNIDTASNVRIKDFDEIVKIAKSKNLNLIFNILAENIDKANNLVGKDLVKLITQNRDILVERYSKDGVVIVDNLELVESFMFMDKGWPTEHYSQQGRLEISKNIALSLKQFYPNGYVEYSNIEIKKIRLHATDVDINRLIEIIKTDSKWYNSIKKKSVEQRLPIQQVLRQDAKWYLNNLLNKQ